MNLEKQICYLELSTHECIKPTKQGGDGKIALNIVPRSVLGISRYDFVLFRKDDTKFRRMQKLSLTLN